MEETFKHTIHYTNSDGNRVQKHFYTEEEVYEFLDELPNSANDVWTAFGEEE